MKVAIELFPWIQTIGWTLIHSLWQALIACVLVMLLIRWIPSRYSRLRYGVACTGLAAIILFSVSTFLYLSVNSETPTEAKNASAFHHSLSEAQQLNDTAFTPMMLMEELRSAIQPH